MSGSLGCRLRRPLGELDPSRDFNAPRPPGPRAPITFDKENEPDVIRGIWQADYDLDEVLYLTNYSSSPVPATMITSNASRDTQDDDPHLDPVGRGQDASAALGNSSEDDVDYEVEGDYDDDELMGDTIEDEEMGVEHDDHDEGDEEHMHEGPVFDPASLGLREINNLAHFGVSSHKPGNGVEELLSDDLDKYWQSDGQQPHLLTIHFMRRVEIRAIRFYVDYNQDESYTPTNVVFYAGTGHHDLIQLAEVPMNNPVGWQDVPLNGCGGGRDGNSLVCWICQMHVKENHQNGKDTHIRGIKIYAADESLPGAGTLGGNTSEDVDAGLGNASMEIGRSPLHSKSGPMAVQGIDEILGDDDINWSSVSDFPQGPSIR